MGWAKFDDQMHRRRKVRGLSDAAWRLYVSAILDCCAERSDGEIEGTYLRELLPSHHEEHIKALVARGLLHDRPGCTSEACIGSQGLPLANADMYVVHDFHQWQMTTEEWEVKRRASEKANHTKWHLNKEIRKQGCRLCYPPVSEPESTSDSGSDSA